MFCFLRFFSHVIVSHSAKLSILSSNKFVLPTSTILVYITYNRISRTQQQRLKPPKPNLLTQKNDDHYHHHRFPRTLPCHHYPVPLIIILSVFKHSCSSGCAFGSTVYANPSLAVLLTILIFAFFITGFCSIYIRHCSEQYVVSGTTIVPRGIDPEVLSTFPIVVYSTVKNLKTGHNVALQCAVCLSEFKDLDKLRLLPKCSHVFHHDCIDAWLASHVTCPVCRTKLKPENAEFKEEIGEGGSENQVFDESSERRGELSCEGNEGGFGGRVDRVVGKGNGTSKVEAFGVLARSHSTGHSLVEIEPERSFERIRLRLPEEVRKQIHDGNNNDKYDGKMKRSASYDVVWQSGEVCGGGGEGSSSTSSKEKNNNRWVLSMKPPLVTRGWGSSASSGVSLPNECTTCSGIPRLWASSAAAAATREEKECEERRVLQIV